jgi:hypothetical protein
MEIPNRREPAQESVNYSFSMGYIPATISEITKRRAEILLELEGCQARAAACRLAISHVNVTLGFCDESGVAREVSRRYTVHKRTLRHGAISNLVMSALRTAEKPMSAKEILKIVSQQLGSKSREIAVRRLDNAVRSALICKMNQGVVTRFKSQTAFHTYGIVRRVRSIHP